LPTAVFAVPAGQHPLQIGSFERVFYTTDAPTSSVKFFDVGATTLKQEFPLPSTPTSLQVTAPVAAASDVPTYTFVGMRGLAELHRYRSLDGIEVPPFQRYLGTGADPTVGLMLNPNVVQDDVVVLTATKLQRFPVAFGSVGSFSPPALSTRLLSSLPSLAGTPIGVSYSGFNVWVLVSLPSDRYTVTRLTEAFNPVSASGVFEGLGVPISIAGAEGATTKPAGGVPALAVSVLLRFEGRARICSFANGTLSPAFIRCIDLDGEPVVHTSSYVGDTAYAWVLTKGVAKNKLHRIELRASGLVGRGLIDFGTAIPSALTVQPGPTFYVDDPDASPSPGAPGPARALAHVVVRL